MVRERRRSRLRRGVQEELIKYFCGGVTARAAAEISRVNRNTAILFYHKLREVIFAALDAATPELMAGEIEVDESHFGFLSSRKTAMPEARSQRELSGRILATHCMNDWPPSGDRLLAEVAWQNCTG